ncbi:long-chain fatty acid transport protein 1 [Phlebotomus argentipes]|uniref:long-chain fatty acid transport protein 1 n=1 Tax=Phlebotomus argentipes TaxID=94469 RepID=UPI002892CFD5|nr:long-chain fatty acid transport protein 1 [Phlebotomus argentipes]
MVEVITQLSDKQKAVTIGVILAVTVTISLLVGGNLIVQGIIFLLGWFLFSGNRPQALYVTAKTLPRDMTVLVRYVKLNYYLKRWDMAGWTVGHVFQSVVRRHPDKVALQIDDHVMTFQDVENLSNQVANYFFSLGFHRGDTIALLMENKPEYGCMWLGLSKIGVVTALINTNLRKDVLLHSIRVAEAKAVIVGTELMDAIEEIRSEEDMAKLPIYQHHDPVQTRQELPQRRGTIGLTDALRAASPEPPTEEMDKGKVADRMVYIYTSGTTGLPKAAVITNIRYMFFVLGCGFMVGVRRDDVIYNPLPLYHTAGGMVGLGTVFLLGTTTVLRKRFSASNFWTDCIKHKATAAQYIGEICRYLLSVPDKPHDTAHTVRLMFGNGLRPQIWPQFVARFNIQDIGEVYGSTEGNSNLANIDNKVGAVGFVPIYAEFLYPVTLIKCNEDTGEPLRDANGCCTKCKPGEAGIFLGKITRKAPARAFGGYADKKASEKKILRDVFRKGDAYFNSGDILVQDIFGYFYFRDRTGDTFRWRGENVATSEVEAVISNIVGLHDCVVYGVEIPHIEGRAGMAAIVDPQREISVENLSNGVRGCLPAYARPLFIRLMDELPMTGTFKMKKLGLQLEGYDLAKVSDPLYYLHSDGVYRPFTSDDQEKILSGSARL